jgi:hypothetical protein
MIILQHHNLADSPCIARVLLACRFFDFDDIAEI